jgi:hypothetical protein
MLQVVRSRQACLGLVGYAAAFQAKINGLQIPGSGRQYRELKRQVTLASLLDLNASARDDTTAILTPEGLQLLDFNPSSAAH